MPTNLYVCTCRFGGGFTGWREPFRLRHVVTGKFLGVKVIQPTDCAGGCTGRGGEEEGGGSELQGKKCRVVLLDPSKATFKASAFCFSDTTVSYGVNTRNVLKCVSGHRGNIQ